VVNVLAIERWDFAIAGYPLYLFATNGLILGLILYPQRSSPSNCHGNDRGVDP
jgi:hypothetical protein